MTTPSGGAARSVKRGLRGRARTTVIAVLLLIPLLAAVGFAQGGLSLFDRSEDSGTTGDEGEEGDEDGEGRGNGSSGERIGQREAEEPDDDEDADDEQAEDEESPDTSPAAGSQSQSTGGPSANNGPSGRGAPPGSLPPAVPPTPHDQSVTTDQGQALDITLTADHPPGLTPIFSIDDGPGNGTVDVDGAVATYTPDPRFSGTDSFDFEVRVGPLTDTATVTITVEQLTPPTADDDAVTTDYETPVTVTLGGDAPSGGTLTFALADPPGDGSVTIVGDEATYTPDDDFFGDDSFTFTADDGFNTSAPATISITVPEPDPPTAHDVNASTDFETPVDITLGATVPSGEPVTFAVVDDADDGTVTIVGGVATYTPDTDFDGDDTFTYTADDGINTSAPATVSVFVEPEPPTAGDVGDTTAYDTAVTIALDGHSPSGQTLTYEIVGDPDDGDVVIADPLSGEVEYTPDHGFAGDDTFTYKVNDGYHDSNTATVTVTVEEPDPPVAQDVTADNAEFETPVDVDLSGHVTVPSGLPVTFEVVDTPANGTVTIVGDVATYTPDDDFEDDDDSFTYKAMDAFGESNTATVTVFVEPEPPTANDVSASTDEDTPVVITLDGVSPSGQTLTYDYDQPDDGTVTGTGPGVTYTPDPGFFGEDTFSYWVNDGYTDSGPATVTVTVTFAAEDYEFDAVGNTPLAVGHASLSGPFASVDGGLLEDADPGFTVDSVDTNNGSVAFDEDDGTFTYTPDAGFTGTDTFEYTLTDGDVSGSGTVTIEVDDLVWYVDNAASSGGDGRAGTPFDNLADAEDDSGEDHTIFVYAGDADYTDGIALQAGQRLLGEEAGLSIGDHDLVDPGGRPAIDAAAGNAIELAAGTHVSHLDITGAPGIGILASDISGCATVDDVTVTGAGGNALNVTGASELALTDVDLTNTGSAAVRVDALSDVLTHTGTITQSGTAPAVQISDVTATGAVTLDEVDAAASGIVIGGGDGDVTIGSAELGSAGSRIANEPGLQVDTVTGAVDVGQLTAWTNGAPAVSADTVGTLEIGGGTVNAQDQAALHLDDIDADITLAGATSASSTGAGLHLADVDGDITIGGGTITGADDQAVNVEGGSVDLDATVAITNAASHAVRVVNLSSGAATFRGDITDTGSGILLSGNTGSTIAFTGTLDLSGSGDTFTASGGGTVTATDADSTVSATSARAVVVTNTAIGAGGLTFESVSATNAVSGIVLTNAGTGPLVVSGDGSANRNGAGGTITGMSSHGVAVTNAGPVTLRNMDIELNDGKGVRVEDGDGLTLAAVNLTDNTDDATDPDARNNVLLDNVTGTVAITDSHLEGAAHNEVDVSQDTGTATINVTDTTIRDNGENSGVLLDIQGSATTTLNVTGSSFIGLHATGVHAFAGDTSTLHVTVDDNTFTDNNVAVNVASFNSAALRSTITGNTVSGHASHSINATTHDTATHDAIITGNDVDATDTVASVGFRLVVENDATMRARVENNTVANQTSGNGFRALAREDAGNLHLVLRNNDVGSTSTGVAYSIEPLDESYLCAAISGNTGGSDHPTRDLHYDLFDGTARGDFEGLTVGQATQSALETYLEAQNPDLRVAGFLASPSNAFGVAAGTCERPVHDD